MVDVSAQRATTRGSFLFESDAVAPYRHYWKSCRDRLLVVSPVTGTDL